MTDTTEPQVQSSISDVPPPTITTPTLPSLPSSLLNSTVPPTLLTQGAEALLFRSTYLLPSIPSALKYRPSKPYRHPILDARLTKHRILSEARVLVKCRREAVSVPAVYALDEKKGWIMMEWIEGEVVRVRINEWLKKRKGERLGRRIEEEEKESQGTDINNGPPGSGSSEGWEELCGLLDRIGSAVGKLHASGVIHGDLTTSNLMLRPWPPETLHNGNNNDEHDDDKKKEGSGTLDGEIVLIDFGLASQSSSDEDRAVDLYVLERAFGSTHPSAEDLFGELLKAYGRSFKGANVVLRKLEDVRMRGRKKSMIG